MSDPLSREFESLINDVFGAVTPNSSKPGPSGTNDTRQGVDPSRFIAVSVFAAAPLAVLWIASSWTTAPQPVLNVLATPIVDSVLAARIPLAMVIALLAVVDIARYLSFRHRVALRRMVYQTTLQDVRWVRVPWWKRPGKLATARIKLIRGSFIPDDRMGKLRTAINRAWATPGKWEYQVEHNGGRDIVAVTRTRVVRDVRSDRHRRLQAALDANSVLPEAKITATGVGLAAAGHELGYRIAYTPNMKTGNQAYQYAVGESLISIAGDHETGYLWTTEWRNDQGIVELRLRAPLPTRVDHPVIADLDDPQYGGDPLHIPYATGEDGRVAVWNISTRSAAPHMLVIGPTGGGKTTLILTVITELVRRGIPVIGVDPKKIELDGINGYPGVAAVIINPLRAAMFVRALCAEMLARMDAVRINKMEAKELPMMCAVLDEFFILSAAWQQLMKTGDKATVETLKALDPLGAIADLGALSRSSGIRLLVGIQRPDAAVFGANSGSVRDNFKTRASLSRLSQDGAIMMWGDAHVGRDVDASVPGRAVVTQLDGDPMDAQVWWTPNLDRHPNKWARMSDHDQQLVDSLIPADAPGVLCYSAELATFIEEEQRLAAQAEIAPEPVLIGGRALDSAETVDDELADALPASTLTEGAVILISGDDDQGTLIPATVVAVTRPQGDSGPVDVRVQIEGHRQIITERFGANEAVFLAAVDAVAA